MESEKSSFSIPWAIIIAGVIIAGAIMFSNSGSSGGTATIAERGGTAPPSGNTAGGSLDNLRPVDGSDHILGNPDAPVKIVEFSDFECPFCKRFHGVVQQIMDEYGADGKVAWVYRQFPLEQLHSKARREAEASECAGELGGNAAFWKYTDRIFEITPSNDGLNLGLLPEIAEFAGLDRAQFEECLDSGRWRDHIDEDIKDAVASGGRGTPFSVVIGPDGQKQVINGAQPYQVVKSIIDQMLGQ